MIDILGQIDAIDREVTRSQGHTGEEVVVLIRRTYDSAITDVWEALTDPDRVKRWFMPLGGELRPGGSFQLEGNASGDIVECEPPHRFKVTFGGPTSLVELRLISEDEDRTSLELEHTVPIEMAQSGAGALYVGPGWDGGFVALDLYLRGEVAEDPVAAAGSPEAIELSRQSVRIWTDVVRRSGTASSEEIDAAVQVALAGFAPEQTEGDFAD
jgi:uncharacterized protein YndB with AHSA1/START domain